ncbi:unnamed protein product [Timema podura]|uniref:Uncharacterized protein n=1 Tax=Timema podura TaxID=61482 RepID=A0ABN7NGD6_TIMPD|nr:unnamed protein product [Timema podura]
MCKHRILLLAVTWVSVTQGDSVRRKSASRLAPTSERVGPPSGAQFFPIPVIPLPEGVLHKLKPGKRPRPTGPPPPPPLKPEDIHTFPQVVETTTSTMLPLPALPITTLSSIRPQRPTTTTTTTAATTTTSTVRPSISSIPTPSPIIEHLATVTPIKSPSTIQFEIKDPSFLRALFNQSDDGSYYFDFEAVNSVAQREEGFLKEVEGLENPVVTKRGYYAFRSPEGLYFHVDYVADENGFRASSDLLPESPKISSTQGY